MPDKFVINELLDFYSGLLNEKQQDICRYYFREDLSLKEIAEIENVSRSAVYDMIKRCRADLTDYEKILHMASSYHKRLILYEKIRKNASSRVSKLIDQCLDTEIEGGQI